MKVTSLRLGFWNVNRIKSKKIDKLEDTAFMKNIENFDILGLGETKHTSSTFNIPHYSCHPISRNSNNGTVSGGLLILIKQSIRKGISFLNSTSEYQWLQLNKTFFNLKNDIYLCICYIPPSSSKYSIDVLENIENDIIKYRNEGSILLCGDFNARTSDLRDHVADDDTANLPLFDSYIPDSCIGDRNNQDKAVCERGKQLIDICISYKLRLANGRTLGDNFGKFTCYKYNGNSVVDYFIYSEDLIEDILSFKVSDVIPRLSDHSLLSLRILASFLEQESKTVMTDFPCQFMWASDSGVKFKQVIESPLIKNKFSNLSEKFDINQDTPVNINSVLEDFNIIMRLAGSLSLKLSKKKKGKIKPKDNKWHDCDLKQLRKKVDYKGSLYAKFPNDPIIRGSFYKTQKEYSKLCKKKRQEFKKAIIDKLDNLCENNPKEYWNLLHTLTTDKTNAPESQIPVDEWLSHFSNLNTPSPEFKNRLDEISKLLSDKEKIPTFSSLDFAIRDKEIIKAINSLKMGKAKGLDGILNEMLKHSRDTITPCLLKIFNYILSSSEYPNMWKISFIKPLFKSKNPLDPANYRGIAIMSCLAKLFNKILNNRLDKFLSDNKIIKKEQIGFERESRTSDHMFILKCLIDKMKKVGNNKLFTCFVDFKKAFDTVVHPALFLKLNLIGINGLFYNILKEMYNNNILSIKIQDKLSPNFISNIGVRQGDTLSPNLFKIFINDLPEIFDESCEPPILGNISINSLMFADDVVLLSNSETGLKNCLKRLEQYCSKWCLKINTEKTKILIFNKAGRLYNLNFNFQNKPLTCVRTYRYLGLIFSASGTFSYAKEDLYQRALKGLFKLKKSFAEATPNIKSCLHIFDHTIKPILLYGSEIWGAIPLSKNKKNSNALESVFEKFSCELLNIKFCKYTLKVHKKASNHAVLGELGRYPLYLDIIIIMLKYFNRLMTLHHDSLLYQGFLVSKELFNSGNDSWYSNLYHILKELNIDIENFNINSIKPKLKLRFKEYWKSKIESNKKLDTYIKFKSNFTKEQYLECLSNPLHRKYFTSLRISAHKLEIEMGRYSKKERHERLCSLCKSVENEVHFLFECSIYSVIREEFIKFIQLKIPNFNILTSEDKFIYIMSCEDIDIIKETGLFIFNCFKMREEHQNATLSS